MMLIPKKNVTTLTKTGESDVDISNCEDDNKTSMTMFTLSYTMTNGDYIKNVKALIN